MLVIRLRRIGKKNKPTYRIVVAEHSFPVNGRFVADLGFYNPHSKNIGLDKEKVVEWMKKGAKPSNSIAKLLEGEKIKHSSVAVIKKSKKPKKAVAEKPAAPATAATETPAEVTEETVESPVEETATEEVPAEPAQEKSDS